MYGDVTCFFYTSYQVNGELAVAFVHVVKLSLDREWVVVAEVQMLQRDKIGAI